MKPLIKGDGALVNRYGRFSISLDLVHQDPYRIMAILSQCLVVRCELLYAGNRLEYIALSEAFSEVPTGMITPEYQVVISEDGERVEFQKV